MSTIFFLTPAYLQSLSFREGYRAGYSEHIDRDPPLAVDASIEVRSDKQLTSAMESLGRKERYVKLPFRL